MNPEDLPDYLKILGKQIENRVNSTFGENDKPKKNGDRDAQQNNDPGGRIRMNANGYAEFEPDWDELDRRADRIVAGYSVVSAAGNVLPMPFDVLMVTATFSKMTTELAGVYQVIVSTKRARQIGWAIATTTGSILGLTYAGSSLMKFIPVAGWIASLAVQAPIIGSVCWAAGDALKQYFKACRQGVEPDINSLRDSFAKTLRIKLATVTATAEKATGLKMPTVDVSQTPPSNPTISVTPPSSAPPTEPVAISDALEQIASLHELYRAGALSKDEYEKKKTELLKRI
ncbi:MAG: DUF697 domain-containing protein [Fibrella sp.]|nr:DUF697 domain-containing protein [Armatimonadota bacterium]